jgi:hypothetical protein
MTSSPLASELELGAFASAVALTVATLAAQGGSPSLHPQGWRGLSDYKSTAARRACGLRRPQPTFPG